MNLYLLRYILKKRVKEGRKEMRREGGGEGRGTGRGSKKEEVPVLLLEALDDDISFFIFHEPIHIFL